MNSTENEAEIAAQIEMIARRLREEWEKARISQMNLSLLAGLSQNQVFCIETGERVPNVYTILKICAALKISPAALFEPTCEERRQARESVIKLVSKYM
ncbi:MAG: helix-turn-helix domain-containing protein [Treponema sp.]|jgi:transcriptional regulator with XRE-family HTH domain|nr:helix-turn-helix domain-containing protein [Treponema sp.]